MATTMDQAQERRIAMLGASRLARLQGLEPFHSQSLAVGATGGAQTVQIPKTINLNRPLESITIQLKGRLAISVGNYADPAPQSFSNLLQQVTLSGTHRKHGSVTPIRMSGATAFVWPRLFGFVGNDLIINSARVTDAGRPFADEHVLTTASSPLDFLVQWSIPMGPVFPPDPMTRRLAAQFYLQPADWQDSLQLQLSIGDSSALGDPTGATTAWTGFGSGAGAPTLSVFCNYAIWGELANDIQSRVLVRNEQPLTGFAGASTAVRLALLQHQTTTNIVVKTGIREATGQSAGIVTLESLSDVQLDRTQLSVDNKTVRNNSDNLASKGYYSRMFGTIQPQGYYLISFVEGQSPLLAYPGRGLLGGAQLELISDVIAANANNYQTVTQESILD